jgi:protein-L-isoaspartate(D-aspartate) O-methyltransferase
LVTAAPRHAPQALLEQLELGGCAVLPVGEYRQQLMKVVREPHRFRQEEHGGVVFVPMTGEALDL